MAPETLPHIFEPFVTTKEAGKGTGLGLSTVYGIIKQSGGHIEVTSKPGEGAVFDLYFRQLEDAVEEPRDRLTPAALPQGTETVLVVEDDDILLNLIKDALQMQGYQVLTAHNGSEAEALCRRHPAPIHLLLTDVVMPRQNGGELAARLTPLHPEMKILYMSGYSEDALAVQGLVEAARPLLQKPFPPLELVRKVREMLDLRN
jgi:CheY-like chemotaxis protein